MKKVTYEGQHKAALHEEQASRANTAHHSCSLLERERCLNVRELLV